MIYVFSERYGDNRLNAGDWAVAWVESNECRSARPDGLEVHIILFVDRTIA